MTDRTSEQEIRAQFAEWAKAVESQDLERIVAPYALDVVAYDAIMALRFEGLEAYRKHWQACLEFCSGPHLFELHDLAVQCSGDLAFCHALMRCGGTGPDGETKSGWMRMTAGLRRRDGRWQVVHEHYSLPFDMESGKALFELQPERTPQALVA